MVAIGAAAMLMGCQADEASNMPDQPEVPANAFFASLLTHCGKAFEGHVVSDDPADADFASERLVMHLAECSDDVIRIPFHVGEDRSRIWVVTRIGEDRLQLKHDHRHEDGTSDAVTMYGGTSVQAGNAGRQEFPVDAESIAMFEREGLEASVVNTWAIEVSDGAFVYELSRPTGRFFRAEFDLVRPVETPPLPWGWTG